METAEFIYKVVVEPSYKKTTREDATCAGIRMLKIEEAILSNTYSNMSERASKHRKIYAD